MGFNNSNRITKKLHELFNKYGLNYDKFLCGGCSKRDHKYPDGIWSGGKKGFCEAQMVGGLVIALKLVKAKEADDDKFISLIEDWIKNYNPSEFRMHDVLIDGKPLEKARDWCRRAWLVL